ncbi:MAG: glycosyltransferase family 39 protein [Candidatus Sumerlaeia bacterium]|nr:glycosyltransferase family 39 protein [Candidatus Sumerlaeia bacterium]
MTLSSGNTSSPPLPWRREALLLAAVLAVATAMRLYDLDRLPPGLWFDEGLAGLNGLSILHEKHFRLYSDNREFFGGAPTYAEEPMYHYLAALAVAVFGPTVLALRLTSAMVGILTVGAFYGMVRTLWDAQRALLAALLLAVFRWHVHFSRTAFRTILVPLFACLFFWLWWRGVERKSRTWLIVAGVVLGLGFYTYFAFQLILPAWLCYGLVRLWRERDRRRELVLDLIWPLGVAILVALPLAGYLSANPDVARGRMGTLSIFTQGPDSPAQQQLAPEQRGNTPMELLAKNVWFNIRQFWGRGDHVAKHNVPYMSVFDPVSGAVFAVGIWAALTGLVRDHRNALILLWTAWLACASIFSLGAPNLLRTVGMIPPVILILTQGYWYVRMIIAKHSRVASYIVLGGLVAGFAGNEIYRYFVLWRNNPHVAREFNTTYREVADLITTRLGDCEVHIPRDHFRHCTLQYLLYGQTHVREMKRPDSLARNEVSARPRVFIATDWTFSASGARKESDWTRWFPRAQIIWESSDGTFFAVQIPADNLLTRERAEEAARRLGMDETR